MTFRKIQNDHFTDDFTKMAVVAWEGEDIDWIMLCNVMVELGIKEEQEVQGNYLLWTRNGITLSYADRHGTHWRKAIDDEKVTWSRAVREGRWEIWRRKITN
jgi:hypothetical protein